MLDGVNAGKTSLFALASCCWSALFCSALIFSSMRITPSSTFMAMVEVILSLIIGLHWVGGCMRFPGAP